MIELENISKIFKIPHEKKQTLFHQLTRLFSSSIQYEEFYALRDVCLSIKSGEFVGIIGKNGSGKTTLLRVIAGIYKPSKGSLKIGGAVTPFIEIGVGFHWDFSCRENIYIYGALLGFSRRELDKKFDEIINFAELYKFVDTKLHHLSAGMQVRLAFAITIQSEAPILLVDEVLAVGDENFQKKCRDIFWKYKQEGRTVVYVSHDLNSIMEFCDRVVLLQNGGIVNEGMPDKVIKYYREFIL